MSKARVLMQEEVRCAAELLALKLIDNLPTCDTVYLYGVPRGGIPAAYLVAFELYRRRIPVAVVNNPAEATFIIDDLVDSGETRRRYAPAPFGALFHKGGKDFSRSPFHVGVDVAADEWLVFPWEGSEIGSAEDIVTRLLQFIGEDPTRGGLRETPARVIKAWRDEWASGYKKDPKEILKQFDDGGEKYDEMILVRDIPVYTHCEHHLAPFFGVAHVAYIPSGRIVGLSKLSRLVDIFARRLQVQERLTTQIAEALKENLLPKGVAVMLKCRHLCMESRGIKQEGSSTVTSKMLGAFLEKPEARAEFLSAINGGSHG